MVLSGTRLVSERFGTVAVERRRTPKDDSDIHLPRLGQKTSSPNVPRTSRYA